MVALLSPHSYHLYYARKRVQKRQPSPPLGTLYAAALLRQQGFSVALFDTMLEDPESGFPAALARHQPRVVAIYEDNFNFLSKMCLSRMRQVAYGILDAARAAGATVVVNGPDPSDHVEEYLRRGFFSLNIVASRGCPYRCNWCARPIYGDSFHIRSAESVAEEMRELKDTLGAEHLWFADDLFGIKPRWVLELADAVERRAAALPFKMQSRVNLMTEETAGALKRAGCTEVWMGVESGSQKILDAMDKGTRVEQAPTARENLQRQGIRACFFLQFGYPGETWEHIQKTIQLVRQTRPDDIGVSVSYPLPGTTFYARVREELGAKTQWVDSDDLSMMFRGAYTDQFYRALHDALHAEVETWSPPSGDRLSGPALAEDESAPSTRVSDLWAKVTRLEKTCRNPEPTLSSAGV